MLASIWAWLSSAVSALGGLLALLNKAAQAAQAEQQQAAGRNEVKVSDATAEAAAQSKISEIATQGQTDVETVRSLNDGTF